MEKEEGILYKTRLIGLVLPAEHWFRYRKIDPIFGPECVE